MINKKCFITKEDLVNKLLMPDIANVKLATAAAGIKYQNRNDVLLINIDGSANVAGVFTKSLCPSAPVEHCRNILSKGRITALVVNSGNANAFTGSRGRISVKNTVEAIAEALGCAKEEVYVASTGVIGEPLDENRIIAKIPELKSRLKTSSWADAAKAIMTTDLFAKSSSLSFILDGQEIVINAIAKGAGMIAPNMATMLGFIGTNAAIESSLLQKILQRAVDKSFNIITVDSDTSTSDSVILFATGKENYITDESDPRAKIFQEKLDEVLLSLALQIVSDGEGATHLVNISVTGAVSDDSARVIARTIADSPLVKTAVAGNDANWGRVVMAVGKAGEPADRDKLAIYFGEYCVAINGAISEFYDESALSEYMKNYQIDIKVDLSIGNGCAEIWTCDLTKEYVAINADYRS